PDWTERSHRPADGDDGKGPHLARDTQRGLQLCLEEDREDRHVGGEPQAASRQQEVLDAGIDARPSRPVKDASAIAGDRPGSGQAELPGGAKEPGGATWWNMP